MRNQKTEHVITGYLSGAIEHAPDGGKGWRTTLRQFLTERLGHRVFDPTTEEYDVLNDEEKRMFRQWKVENTERFIRVVRRILDRDITFLQQETDYVICYWDQHVTRGGGTHGELTVAYMNRIPVYLVLGMPLQDISGWIIGCATHIFGDFSSLKEFLLQHYQKK
jgi:hypothetical protein